MKLTKIEKSWIMYDVACSSFTLILTATIPVFFRGLVTIESVAANPIAQALFAGNIQEALAGNTQAFEALVSSLFALTTTVAVVIVALMAPIIGAIADYKGMKKKLFLSALALGIAGLFTLGITQDWMAYLVFIIITRIGYTSANIFYDSMLIDVTTDDRMDYVSSSGYAWGYAGSCIPFIIGIYFIMFLPFGLDVIQATQLSFLITAVWWMLLSIPVIKNVNQVHYLEKEKLSIGKIFKRVGETLKKISKDKILSLYIIGYFFYIDGVYTVISMSTTYGAEVGIDTNAMIIALLVTQLVAFPFAILAGKYAKKIGPLKLIRFFIFMYILICMFGYQLDQAWEFWVLAISVGMAQGGIQSLSRSYYGKLIPKKEASEYFGFFDIFGKFADFFGPLILTICASVFGASKYGILALAILFIIGYILITKVEKLVAEKERLSQ